MFVQLRYCNDWVSKSIDPNQTGHVSTRQNCPLMYNLFKKKKNIFLTNQPD
ncbi:hypothetical protein HanIR_Chr17g0862431 [Helianthus annuus]|nr:hypothetical protein HanIR_Chr17g0862431 [Helianthus annuus]